MRSSPRPPSEGSWKAEPLSPLHVPISRAKTPCQALGRALSTQETLPASQGVAARAEAAGYSGEGAGHGARAQPGIGGHPLTRELTPKGHPARVLSSDLLQTDSLSLTEGSGEERWRARETHTRDLGGGAGTATPSAVTSLPGISAPGTAAFRLLRVLGHTQVQLREGRWLLL